MTLTAERWKIRLVGGLLVISILAVAFQSLSFTRVLRIDNNPLFPMDAIDDRSNQGNSSAQIIQRDGKLILVCDIRASDFAWPYCEITWNLSRTNTQGTNLSHFSQVKIWASYTSPQPLGIRFQARNFNPAYSQAGDESSYKYNSVELFKHGQGQAMEVPLGAFQVPTWWVATKAINPELGAPEFANVISLELATGNNIQPGHYEIEIERIEFQGKLLSDSLMYLSLLAIWGLFGLGYFTLQLRFIRRELFFSSQRQRELESLNRLLNIKSKNLEERLSRDPLTGVLNRQGIAYLFEPGIHDHGQMRLALMFIDVDSFKQVNDNHGHAVGDQVLINFAEILRNNIRDSDVLARWGGEEFVIACPNTDLLNAGRLAEKLRAIIQTSSWPESIKLTASFGVAELAKESPAEFIARADKALYEAKDRGRNRVVVALDDLATEISTS